MKKIEAIIREEKFDAVKEALEYRDIIGLTVSRVSGRGMQKGILLQYPLSRTGLEEAEKALKANLLAIKDMQKVLVSTRGEVVPEVEHGLELLKAETLLLKEKVLSAKILDAKNKIGYDSRKLAEDKFKKHDGEFRVDIVPKIKLEVVVRDTDCATAVKTIINVGRTGENGDGVIFVLPVEEIYRVRTGGAGESVFEQ